MKKLHFAAVGRDIHLDTALSNIAINYRPEGMIADMIAPVIPVPNITGQIPEFNRNDVLRISDTRRAPGNEANSVRRNVSSDSFVCLNYALKYPVTIEDRANADPIYVQGLFNGAVEFLSDKLALDWENRIATQVTNTSNVGSSAAVSSGWTDYTNSTPLTDCQTAVDNIKDSVGKRPNRCVMGEAAWRSFRRNDTVRNLIFGTNNGGGYPSEAQAADLLEVDQLLIGGAYKATNEDGQTESLAQVWNDYVLFYFAPTSPSIMTPSFMYTMRWQAAGIPDMQVERHPFNTLRKVEETELGYYQDEKITGSEYSFLLTAVNSST